MYRLNFKKLILLVLLSGMIPLTSYAQDLVGSRSVVHLGSDEAIALADRVRVDLVDKSGQLLRSNVQGFVYKDEDADRVQYYIVLSGVERYPEELSGAAAGREVFERVRIENPASATVGGYTAIPITVSKARELTGGSISGR